MKDGFPIKILTAAVVLTMVFLVGVGWYVAFFAIAAIVVVVPILLCAWLGVLRLMSRHITARQRAQEELRLVKEAAEEGRQLVEQLYRIAISMQTSWEREDRLQAFIRGAHEAAGFDRFYVLLTTPVDSGFEL